MEHLGDRLLLAQEDLGSNPAISYYPKYMNCHNATAVTLWQYFHAFFVDVEGTKRVKRMISLLAIIGQFIPQNRCGSQRLRKQMC